jgi:hypothetical protein
MQKRYEFKFETPKGTVTLGADDLSDDSINHFLNGFLGVSDNQKSKHQDADVERFRSELEAFKKEVRDSLVQAPLPKVKDIPERPQQPQQVSQVQQLRQVASEADFMGIPPDRMRQDVWNTLSDSDKNRWMEKYNIQ